MKWTFLTAAGVVAVLSGAPALAQNPSELVSQAVAAQGGADALRAFKAAIIKGDAKHWEPGQSFKAGGEAKFLGDSAFTMTADGVNRTVRIDWDRDMKYPAVERIKYSEIITPTHGVVTNDKGSQPMSGIRLASQLREFGRQTPVLLLRAMESPQNVGAIENQKVGERTLPAVAFTSDGTKYIIAFDPATKLPAAVRTRDDDHIYGDSNYDMILSDWKDTAGIKLAHSYSFQLNGIETQRIVYKEVTANPTIAPDTFAVSDEVKAKAKTAASDAPYQWVLRRVFLGRFVDSDQVMVPVGGSLKLSELSPNVQQVVGGGANNLIVAMKDGIVVFDAPIQRYPVALGDRRRQGQVPGQADQAPGADPPPHGPHRRHARLCGRRCDRDRAGTGQGVFRRGRQGPAYGRARCARAADQAGEPRWRDRPDVAQGRYRRDQPAQHPQPAFRWHDHRPCGEGQHRVGDGHLVTWA